MIGHCKTGNNRGDTKVVNAPINAFGRRKEAMDALQSDAVGRGKALAHRLHRVRASPATAPRS